MFNHITHPILYSFRRCPYAIRARYALYINSKSVILREVILKDKPSELLQISKKATVPVLKVSGDEILDESFEIVLWAYDLSKENLTQAVLSLVKYNDLEFKPILDAYKYPEKFQKYDGAYILSKANEYFNSLDLILSSQPFLFSDVIGLCDICIFPFIRQFYNCDKEFFENIKYKNLRKWLFTILDHDDFNHVMKKYPQWVSAQEEVVF